jgi:uncharacterized SAM-binding protein YcdF (DUF218 family)
MRIENLVIIPGSSYDKNSLHRAGAACQKFGNNAVYVTSAGKGGNKEVSVAEWMKNYLTRHLNVPEEQVITEDNSYYTWQNAVETRKKLEQIPGVNKFTRMHVVTTSYHLPRVQVNFLRLGKILKGHAVGSDPGKTWRQLTKSTLKEVVGIYRDGAVVLTEYLTKKPSEEIVNTINKYLRG